MRFRKLSKCKCLGKGYLTLILCGKLTDVYCNSCNAHGIRIKYPK
jgi:hypothetical protein